MKNENEKEKFIFVLFTVSISHWFSKIIIYYTFIFTKAKRHCKTGISSVILARCSVWNFLCLKICVNCCHAVCFINLLICSHTYIRVREHIFLLYAHYLRTFLKCFINYCILVFISGVNLKSWKIP